LDEVLTFRDRPSVQGTVKTLMNDADLHWRIQTGAIAQHIIVGLEADREEADLTRFANQLNQIPGTPILNPDPFEPFPGHQTQVTQLPDTVTKTISGLLEDIVDFGPQWEATAAVRVDRFTADFDDFRPIMLLSVQPARSPRRVGRKVLRSRCVNGIIPWQALHP